MNFKPITDAEVARIKRETRERNRTEPRAVAATYDVMTGRLTITMQGGAILSVQVTELKVSELNQATPEQLAEVFVSEGGAALFWDELDVQIGIMALLQIVFQIKTVQSITQRGGRSRSAAKVAASRANGTKGGRPKKATQKLGATAKTP